MFAEKEEYCKDHFPITVGNDFQNLLTSGLIYIHGRDRSLRPFLIVNSKKLVLLQNNQTNEQSLINLAIFIVEYVIKYILVPERIENFNVIIDMTGISVRNFPKETFSNILGTLTKIYQCKINQIFCLNTPISFSIYLSTFSLGIDP